MKRGDALLFAALLVLCVSCDHGAKQIAGSHLGRGASHSFLDGALHLELAYNPGAFLSIGAFLPGHIRVALLLALAPLGLALLCAVAVRSGLSSGWAVAGLGLLAGGGLGNWLDRLLHGGAVTDFVRLGVGPLRTGIFNLADVCIVAGVAILLLAQCMPSRPRAG